MKLHPRVLPMQRASNELAAWLLDWCARHDLTVVEELICLDEQTARVLKTALREERHPDSPDRRAGEANDDA